MTILSSDGAARDWVRERFGVSRETMLADFAEMVRAEASNQNLVSAATLDQLWLRHIADSAQLLTMLPKPPTADDLWIDIGTGAGFPGVVAAILVPCRVRLVEPRKRRAAFLAESVAALGLHDRVEVAATKIEQQTGKARIISARAVAVLPALLQSAAHLARRDTIWLLPKGVNALEEVAVARKTWHGSFHVEQSLTQPGSLILIATGVARR